MVFRRWAYAALPQFETLLKGSLGSRAPHRAGRGPRFRGAASRFAGCGLPISLQERLLRTLAHGPSEYKSLPKMTHHLLIHAQLGTQHLSPAGGPSSLHL